MLQVNVSNLKNEGKKLNQAADQLLIVFLEVIGEKIDF